MTEHQFPIQVVVEDTRLSALATELITQVQGVQTPAPFALRLTAGRVELHKLDEPKLGGVYVDFVAGGVAHRRKFGGGRGQSIAKAVGLKHGHTPSIVDGTAGLGRDAFVLASLGCSLTLCERHPVVHALLADGLRRAALDEDIGHWVSQRLVLLPFGDTLADITEQPDVVYLDPMFPHKKKSALVKKEMRIFHSLVGPDADADSLLAAGLTLARARVVVKRPSYAGFLNEQTPVGQVTTKNNRFDLYVKAAL